MSSDGAHGDAALEKGEKQEFQQVSTLNTDSDNEAAAARGVESGNIPKGYWWSFRFLGTFTSIVLLAASLFVNFNLPVS